MGVTENKAQGISTGQVIKAKESVPYLTDKQQYLPAFFFQMNVDIIHVLTAKGICRFTHNSPTVSY